MGPWTLRDDEAAGHIVVEHTHNRFDVLLRHRSAPDLMTRSGAAERLVPAHEQDPVDLPGSSGLSPESVVAARRAWETARSVAEAQAQADDCDWLGLPVAEGWVVTHRRGGVLLVLSLTSNGWIGVLDGDEAGTLLGSALRPGVSSPWTL